jgi:hypothetical protein
VSGYIFVAKHPEKAVDGRGCRSSGIRRNEKKSGVYNFRKGIIG